VHKRKTASLYAAAKWKRGAFYSRQDEIRNRGRENSADRIRLQRLQRGVSHR